MLFTHAAVIANRFDFLIREERTLSPNQGAGARPQEEHVTATEQLVGTVFVKHHAAVGLTCDLEAKSRGQVTLNQAGDHVDGWFLCGQDQVNAHRATLLSQTNDVLFHVFAGGHHQVSHLVGDNHNEWQALWNR